jgi:hypothetical protein
VPQPEVIPVAAAPWLFGERWTATAGGGLLVATGLLLVLAGGGLLGSSRPVTRLEEPGPVVDERKDEVSGDGALPVAEVRRPR